ncbi:MAG: carbohydrate kinase family protein [Anaerolineales bacterium]|nr:carbohydrate kinase family protein [Anaerolineales bacterium]
MRILFTGSIAYDYLMTFPGYFKDNFLPDKLESISLSFLVDSMTRQRGGIAPNIAYTHALLGGRPLLMGTAGEDFGDYRAWLEQHGVDCGAVKVIAGTFTASFFATTDKANAQLASFYPGAMAFAAVQSLYDLPEPPDLVVISPNAPDAMRKFVRECRALKIRYVFDPSQQLARMTADVVREDVDGAWMLAVNDYEFGLIEKMTGWDETEAQKHVAVLVITRGEQGATLYAGGVRTDIAIVPASQVVDPTGVGDAFRAGLLRGVAAGWPWPLCGQIGALAATYCLENTGPQNHHYTLAEFLTRFRQHFDDGELLNELF